MCKLLAAGVLTFAAAQSGAATVNGANLNIDYGPGITAVAHQGNTFIFEGDETFIGNGDPFRNFENMFAAHAHGGQALTGRVGYSLTLSYVYANPPGPTPYPGPYSAGVSTSGLVIVPLCSQCAPDIGTVIGRVEGMAGTSSGALGSGTITAFTDATQASGAYRDLFLSTVNFYDLVPGYGRLKVESFAITFDTVSAVPELPPAAMLPLGIAACGRRQLRELFACVHDLAVDDGERAFQVLDLLDVHGEVVARQDHQAAGRLARHRPVNRRPRAVAAHARAVRAEADRDIHRQHFFDRRHLARLGAILFPVQLALEVQAVLHGNAAAQRLDAFELPVADGFGVVEEPAQAGKRRVLVHFFDHGQVAVDAFVIRGVNAERPAVLDQQAQHRLQFAFHLVRHVGARLEEILEVGRAPYQVFAAALGVVAIGVEQVFILVRPGLREPALVVFQFLARLLRKQVVRRAHRQLAVLRQFQADRVIVGIRLAAAARVDRAGQAQAVELAGILLRGVQLLVARQHGGPGQRGVQDHGVRLGDQLAGGLAVRAQFHHAVLELGLGRVTQRLDAFLVQEAEAVQVQQEDRLVGHCLVDFLERGQAFFFELEFVPAAHHLDPGAVRRARSLLLEHLQRFFQRRHAVPAQLGVVIEAFADDVQVRVVEAGDHGLAGRVDHLRAGGFQFQHAGIAAHGFDLAVLDGDGLGKCAFLRHRGDFAVGDDQAAAVVQVSGHEIKPARAGGLLRLLLDGFDGEVQRDFVADVRCVFTGIEFGTLDLGGGVGAACHFFHHRVVGALEVRDGQGHRLGDALDGQVAVDGRRGIALEVDLGRLVGDGRELAGVQEVFALDVAVEQLRAGVDRLGVDGGFHRTGFRGAVHRELGGGVVEAAGLHRVAEVAVAEAGERVVGIGSKGFRCSKGGHRDTGSDQQGKDFFHCQTPVCEKQ
uniref:Uncharacterized protein n=1 Tax=Tanacetum cinerariifolium TaxID=118510 RepID=A0A699GEK8_TANCI|nr:hypothetical protein [Tanacetum cinerariifolium]